MEKALISQGLVFITLQSVRVIGACYVITNVSVCKQGVFQIAGDIIKSNVKEISLPIANTILIEY